MNLNKLKFIKYICNVQYHIFYLYIFKIMDILCNLESIVLKNYCIKEFYLKLTCNIEKIFIIQIYLHNRYRKIR